MAAFVKFNALTEHLAEKVHNLGADVLKVYLTNTAPNVSTMTVRADLTGEPTGTGYAAGGNTAAVSTSAQTAGVYKLVLSDPPTWTAGAGGITAFRYAVIYNDTPTSPADPLIGYWDYGSSVSLAEGETFTVDLDQTNGVLQIA